MDVSRHGVRPEMRLEMPGLGAMELAAVVYHSGRRVTSGHYTCACRDVDGRFWVFDDFAGRVSGCWQLPGDVELFLQRRVYLMVYVRPRGAAEFADMGGGPVQEGGVVGGEGTVSRKGLASAGALVQGSASAAEVGS